MLVPTASPVRAARAAANRTHAERRLIQKGKRRLMRVYDWTERAAYAAIRTASMNQHRPMVDVAKAILNAGAEPAQALRPLPPKGPRHA